MSAPLPNLEQQNPYLGLRPFREQDKDFFFGREQEIHILTDKILANRLTLLVAASGVGKSSLLQAGVMPALRASGMADLIYHKDWAIDPLKSLKHSVIARLVESRRIGADYEPDPAQSLDQFLRIHSLLAQGMLVILLDQFEEFFYYHRFSRERDAFIEQLAAAIRDAETRAAFVISMREDFAMELSAFKPYLRSVFDSVYRIEKLDLNAARLAIEGPARKTGFHFEPALTERLLRDLGSREREVRPDYQNFDAQPRVEPPHLQIVCEELWRRAAQNPDGSITSAEYEKLAGAKGILESYFKSKIDSLSDAQKRVVSRAFDLLVSEHGAKMAYPLAELAERIDEAHQVVQAALELLQKAAILRRIQRQEEPWYELYHDLFAPSIHAWNRAYKERQLRKRFLIGGSVALFVLVSAWLAYDGYINHHDRHLRLGKESVSERVEIYQGAKDGADIFQQRSFLFESDFERAELEADKRFEQNALADLDQTQEYQIGLLPLEQRFLAYARDGLYGRAFLVADNIKNSKDDRLLTLLLRDIPLARIETTVGQLDSIRNGHLKNTQLLKSVIVALSRLNSDSAIDLLESEFKRPNSLVKVATIQALGQLHAESAIPELVEQLHDGDIFVRLETIKALVQLRAKPSLSKLVELLRDDEPSVREVAIDALVKLKAKSLLSKLVELLLDDYPNVRAAAIQGLVQLKAESAIPKIVERLQDVDPFVRHAAIYALIEFKYRSMLPTIIKRLQDNSPNVRRAAIEAVVLLNFESAIPNLIECLQDDDAFLRSAAAWALAQLKAESAIPKLVERLQDEDSGVRNWVIWAMIQLGVESAIPKLVERLQDEDFGVRNWALSELVELQVESAIPKLVNLVKHGNADVRSAAILVLVKINAEFRIQMLIERMHDDDPNARRAAIKLLAQLKAESAIPKLVEQLQDDDPTARYTAIRVLAQLKAESAIPKLVERLQDEKANVRQAAVDALGRLRSESAIPQILQALSHQPHNITMERIEMIPQAKGESAIPLFFPAVNDEEVFIQSAEIQSLGRLKAKSAILEFLERMQSDYPDVRREAIWALGQLEANDAIPRIVEQFQDKDLNVRSAAINTLARLKAESAIPLIQEGLRDYESSIRIASIEALGLLGAKEEALEILSLFNESAELKQSAGRALSRMRIDGLELAAWQDQQIREASEKLKSGSHWEKANAVKALSFVVHPRTVDLLVNMLGNEGEQVLANALNGLGEIGAYHPEWLKAHLDKIVEIAKHANPDLQEKAIAAIGQILSFQGDALPDALGAGEARLRNFLSALAQDVTQKKYLRAAAIDALGECGSAECAEALGGMFQDENQIDFRFAITHWLGVLRYGPALPELQRQLDTLTDEKRKWRDNRDQQSNGSDRNTETLVASVAKDGSSTADPANVTSKAEEKPKTWQKDALIWQAAYAIAAIDPKNEGISLLAHEIYAVRQAAVIALAGRADGALIQKLTKKHQDFDPEDLPSPLPYALFQALDRALYTLEVTGTHKDLKILQNIKQKGLQSSMPSQQQAIDERFDWTIAELSHRLEQR